MNTILATFLVAFTATISSPKLPNGGGHAAPCLKGLIQPLLAKGQSFIGFSGPFSETDTQGHVIDKLNTDYEMITRLPVAHYKIRFTTSDVDGWQAYQYMEGDTTQIGMLASVTAASAVILLRHDENEGPFIPFASVDLGSCETLLQAGN